MQHLQIRFLIGLRRQSDLPGMVIHPDTAADRVKDALAILSREYPCLGSWQGTGYWKGQPEPSLTVETIVEVPEADGPDAAVVQVLGESFIVGRAQSLAGEVARALGQEAVGVVVQPVEFSLEGPYATEG